MQHIVPKRVFLPAGWIGVSQILVLYVHSQKSMQSLPGRRKKQCADLQNTVSDAICCQDWASGQAVRLPGLKSSGAALKVPEVLLCVKKRHRKGLLWNGDVWRNAQD